LPISEEAYVHARFADGETRLVGRYRYYCPDDGKPEGQFQYVGSWYRNDHGRAFAPRADSVSDP
jgi:serine/threonine-protein kinase HipA